MFTFSPIVASPRYDEMIRLRSRARASSSSAPRSCRRALLRRRPTAAGCARTDRPARPRATCDSVITQKLLITTPVVDRRVDDAHAGVDFAAGADARAPFEIDVGMEDRVGADRRRRARSTPSPDRRSSRRRPSAPRCASSSESPSRPPAPFGCSRRGSPADRRARRFRRRARARGRSARDPAGSTRPARSPSRSILSAVEQRLQRRRRRCRC